MAELVAGDKVQFRLDGDPVIGKLHGYRGEEALVIVRHPDEPGIESLNVYVVNPDVLERVNG